LSWAKTNAKNIRIASTLGGFYNEFNNLINYAPSTNNAAQFTLVNIDKFKTTGITLENNVNWKNLQLGIGFSYIGQYNRFSADDQYKNDNFPLFVWSPEINSTIIYNWKKTGTSFSLFYKYTGKTPGYELVTVGNKEVVQPTNIADYSWADFTISKNVCTYFILSGGVKNFFDVNNIANTSNNSNGLLHTAGGTVSVGYGRSYFLSLAFQWNKK
jgi:outer membrane receptor for ferrienterochelin and colicins